MCVENKYNFILIFKPHNLFMKLVKNDQVISMFYL